MTPRTIGLLIGLTMLLAAVPASARHDQSGPDEGVRTFTTSTGGVPGPALLRYMAEHAIERPLIGPPVATATVTPICNAGHYPVICPYLCSDGKDNDGDGLIDFPADPSCTSASDDGESRCVEKVVFADVWTPSATEVWENAAWVYSCPGSPHFTWDQWRCNAPSGWYETSGCPVWDPSATSWGTQGTFSCISSCGSHTLGAAVTYVGNTGSYACQFKATTGVSVWCGT